MAIIRRTRVPQEIEDAILTLAMEQPILGRDRVAAELNRRGFEASPSTVRSVWQRHGLTNAAKRIAAFAVPAQAKPIVTSLPADETLVIPAPHEIAANARPASSLMADALVFSVAVLTAIGHDSTNDLDLGATVSHTDEQIMAVLGEDHGAVIAHVPAEATDDLQFNGSRSDLLAA